MSRTKWFVVFITVIRADLCPPGQAAPLRGGWRGVSEPGYGKESQYGQDGVAGNGDAFDGRQGRCRLAVRGEAPDAVILGVVEKSKGRGGGIRLPRTDVVQPCGQDFFGFFGVSGPAGFYSDGTAGFSVLVGFAFFFFAGGRDPKTLQILIDQSVNFLIFLKIYLKQIVIA